MGIFLAFAAAGATWIGGLQTQLSPTEASDLNILISAVDAERELRHPYPQFLFEVDMSRFDACKLRDVGIQFFNDRGQLAFSSSIDDKSGFYSFQILEEFLDTATLLVVCDAGPDTSNPVYTIELRAYGRNP